MIMTWLVRMRGCAAMVLHLAVVQLRPLRLCAFRHVRFPLRQGVPRRLVVQGRGHTRWYVRVLMVAVVDRRALLHRLTVVVRQRRRLRIGLGVWVGGLVIIKC